MSETRMQRQSRDDEIRRVLEAYAAQRLSPDPAAVTRVRAAVLRAHGDTADEPGRSARAGAPLPPPLPFRPRPGGVVRRVGSALLAASLGTAVVAGSALAATPGGLLYGVRVWSETLTLPLDTAARASVELQRLDIRIAEALAELRAGDEPGAGAALAAFRQILDETLVLSSDDDDLLAKLEERLAIHRTVLEDVLLQVPVPARSAIERALERSSQAADRIRDVRGAATGHGADRRVFGKDARHPSRPGPAGGVGGPAGPDASAKPTKPDRTNDPGARPRPGGGSRNGPGDGDSPGKTSSGRGGASGRGG